MNFKKKGLWALASFLLAVFTVWFIIYRSGMSMSDFLAAVGAANPWWILMGIVCMFGYVFFEGAALLQIIRTCGYPQKVSRGFMYAAADTYLSAITPSGSGGQPGIALFMMKDGVPAAVVTAALIVNLIGFNVGLLFHGILGMIFGYETFINYNTLGKVLVIVGFVVFIGLTILAAMMLKHREFIFRFAMKMTTFLHKIHLIRDPERIHRKLGRIMEEYKTCVDVVSSHKGMWFRACLMNIIQRFAQIAITVFAFRALGGHGGTFRLFGTQCLATIGSTCIPIPGAMGVSDYLMIEGYEQLMPKEFAFQVQMLSRSLSFYSCVIICGITMVIGLILIGRKEKK
ncbi:MAG: flippase-like domain-containing protein [Eubacterium sp.]|nr:flippase-like domain-containing protein [Eubacterium sp.]